MTPIQRAGEILAAARARRDSLPPAVAAAEAAQPGDDVRRLQSLIEAQRSKP
jgi:hypothetical protein